MKKLIISLAIVLVGCGGQPLPTYSQLEQYPLDCKKKHQQISELQEIQRLKFFGPDPDAFDREDKAYFALLKEHIWWFSYNCEK